MDKVSSNPGPRGSQGMAQCYSSSINIGPLTIQSQLFLNREKLGCKGFIHLHTEERCLTVFRSRENLAFCSYTCTHVHWFRKTGICTSPSCSHWKIWIHQSFLFLGCCVTMNILHLHVTRLHVTRLHVTRLHVTRLHEITSTSSKSPRLTLFFSSRLRMA